MDLLERSLRLAVVMRSFAVLRGHEELADGWASAGLFYHPDADSPIPVDELRKAGANDGYLQLLTLTKAPAMAVTPTASQELSCLLTVLDPLMRIITELIHTKYSDPKSIKVSAVQKIFSDKKMLPQVSRQQILDGTHALHWEIGDFTSKTLKAVCKNEPEIKAALKKLK